MLYEFPEGGDEIKVMPIIKVSKADNPTEPTPVIPDVVLPILFPKSARIKNPAKGKAGTSHSKSNIINLLTYLAHLYQEFCTYYRPE